MWEEGEREEGSEGEREGCGKKWEREEGSEGERERHFDFCLGTINVT